ncbi:HAMP domain-containing protein [Paenibacillus alkaliterrae]|uniref:sensor histidine kinase n=1 Tax=Paenibacillus alkaliterrae TaxID=320909 RepID=UPI001F19D690|nr:HAMP domain-containing protein [Paenibacillus alkaliterrae]MCF2941858.1 HAMP domain-containing protein [Paenibacillus alkaliterrae]
MQTHQDRQSKDEDNWVISNVRKVFDMKDGRLLGVMVVSIDIDFIDKVNGRLLESRRSAFTILDEHRNIVYNSETILYMPLGELSAEEDILRRNLIMTAFLLILFAVISSFYVSTRITRPIKILMRNMISVERGQFENLPTKGSNDEIGLLAKRFNLMSHELSQRSESDQCLSKNKCRPLLLERSAYRRDRPYMYRQTAGMATSQRWSSI